METTPSTKTRATRNPFVALQHNDFRLIWIGQLISVAGTQMQTIAINWHVWELTHSPLALGLIGLARLVPIIFFSLVAGVTADTRDRKRVMMITQTTMMVIAALLGLFTLTGLITAVAIYALSAISAAASSFDAPARQSLIPNLVPRAHLTNALTLNSIQMQTAAIVGPGLAGVLIARYGVGSVYWINAASFLAVLAALLMIKAPGQQAQPRENAPTGLHSLREGLHFVFHQRIIFSTMLLDFFATFFASANTLLPVFATDVLHTDAVGFGILSGCESVGSVLAAAVVSLFGDIKAKGIVLLTGISIYGLATVLFGFSHIFALSVVALALLGIGDTVSTIMRQTIRQLVTPDHLRGRMTSVNMIFFMGGPQLGEMESGIAAQLLGAPLSVILGGIGTLILVGLTVYLVPALRNYHD